MYEYRAYIRSVYDGDTVRADIDLGFGVHLGNQKIRLDGIDAPEITGEERPRGLESRDALRDAVEGMTVVLVTRKDAQGKYGRWLGTIHFQGRNMNEWMVEQGYATRYAL